jgi:hypothetical protein
MIEDLKQVLLAFFPGHDWGHLRGEERRQRRRLIALLSGVALLFLIIAIAAVGFAREAQRRQHEARSRELAAYAVESLLEDSERSVALGIQAVEATWQFHQAPPLVAEETLHRALLASHEQLVVRGRQDVTFSPDGKRLVTAGDDYTARVWDVGSGRVLCTLRGHKGRVESVSFSPDGKHVATGSEDKTAKLWDADSGKELLTLDGHTLPVISVAFSPDRGRLANCRFGRHH